MGLFNNRRLQVVKSTFSKKEKEDPSSSHDELINFLYSKDSRGRLDLSLGLVLSGKVRPEVRQYVEDNLLRSSMVSGSSCNDPDIALENVVPFSMQYGNERDFVSRQMLDRFSSYVKKNKSVE